jgi:hypothetical protein
VANQPRGTVQKTTPMDRDDEVLPLNQPEQSSGFAGQRVIQYFQYAQTAFSKASLSPAWLYSLRPTGPQAADPRAVALAFDAKHDHVGHSYCRLFWVSAARHGSAASPSRSFFFHSYTPQMLLSCLIPLHLVPCR